MKKRQLYFVLLISLTLTAISTVSAQNNNSSVMEAIVRRHLAAQLAYDVPELKKITTDDYIEVSPLGEFDPREKMLGFYSPDLKPTGLEVTSDVSEISVRDYGKFGIVIARIDHTVTNAGKALPSRGIRGTFVIRKIKNEWKIASAQYTGIRPTTTTAPTSK